MLINERKPLGVDPWLESDLLERELEKGVIVEEVAAADDSFTQSALGGLVTAEEHVQARRLSLGPRRRRAK